MCIRAGDEFEAGHVHVADRKRYLPSPDLCLCRSFCEAFDTQAPTGTAKPNCEVLLRGLVDRQTPRGAADPDSAGVRVACVEELGFTGCIPVVQPVV